MRDIELAADLLDAAIEQNLWVDLIDRMSAKVGTKSGVVLSSHLVEDSIYGCFRASSVFDAETLNTWQTKYAEGEADAMQRFVQSQPFEILHDGDVWPSLEDYSQRPEVKFFREHVGIFHKFGARLNSDLAWLDILVLHLGEEQGRPRQAHYDAFAEFLPMASETMKLGRVFGVLKERFKAVLSVLDRYRVAVFMVSEKGQVILENATARDLLDRHDGVARGPGSMLQLHQGDDQARLLEAIGKVSKTARAAGLSVNESILMARPSGGDPFFLEVSPLRDTDSEIERFFRGALVTVYDPDHRIVPNLNGFNAVHGLTAAEAAVTRLIIDGADTAEIAERRNTSIDTVRTQVKSILHKTKSRNRTELVRRAVISAPPIDTV